MNPALTAVGSVYLRCDEPVTRVDWQAVETGLREARKCGAVRFVAKGVRPEVSEVVEKATRLALRMGLSVRVDLEVKERWDPRFDMLMKKGIEVVARTAPQTPAQGTPAFPRSVAPHVTTYVVVDGSNQRCLEADVETWLVVNGVRRVVLLLSMDSGLKPAEYVELCARMCRLAAEYPGRVWARLPWAFLDGGSWSVVRRLCDYARTIGVCLDGGVVPCGVKRPAGDGTPTVRDAPLKHILRSDRLMVSFRETRLPDSVQGVCRRCVFRRYCANICPAHVYNVTGSCTDSYPDCEVLEAHGLFPKQCLVSEWPEEMGIR
jgi:radical SAM protein with 4Fe4S-binding SPASM domain